MSSKMNAAGIVLTQGDTLNIPLCFARRQNGKKIPVNLDNAVIRMQVRKDAESLPVITKEVANHYDADNGKTILQLTPGDTNVPVGIYYTDIEEMALDHCMYALFWCCFRSFQRCNNIAIYRTEDKSFR